MKQALAKIPFQKACNRAVKLHGYSQVVPDTLKWYRTGDTFENSSRPATMELGALRARTRMLVMRSGQIA